MNAVIIEDEEIIARVLQNKIMTLSPDIKITGILPSLKTAKRWFAENAEPDLLFMDIQLSDGISFDLFNFFQLKCPVIFTTAYDEYAITAFKKNGIDYLLKPVNDDELTNAINKSKQFISNNSIPQQKLTSLIQAFLSGENSVTYKEKFIVNYKNQWIPVNTNQIACFYKDVINYVYLLSGEKYTIDYNSLDEIEHMLNPKQFYRANRQVIINIEALQSVKSIEGSKLIVLLKEPNHKLDIDISRIKTPEFKKWIDR